VTAICFANVQSNALVFTSIESNNSEAKAINWRFGERAEIKELANLGNCND